MLANIAFAQQDIVNSVIGDEERRLALIIGNSAYEGGDALKSPKNDAKRMKETLSLLGFTVIYAEDADLVQMQSKLIEFKKEIPNYKVALFYYSGHGVQMQGTNYLVPIKADLKKMGEDETWIKLGCLRVEEISEAMNTRKDNLKIIILDACRNNPIKHPDGSTKSLATTENQGLVQMAASAGTIIIYATGAGKTASDGDGKNSLFTSAFLESINRPKIGISQVFSDVGFAVAKKSENRQTPELSTKFYGQFFFKPEKYMTAEEKAVEKKKEEEEKRKQQALIEAETRKIQMRADSIQRVMQAASQAERDKLKEEQNKILADQQRLKDEQARTNAELERLRKEKEAAEAAALEAKKNAEATAAAAQQNAAAAAATQLEEQKKKFEEEKKKEQERIQAEIERIRADEKRRLAELEEKEKELRKSSEKTKDEARRETSKRQKELEEAKKQSEKIQKQLEEAKQALDNQKQQSNQSSQSQIEMQQRFVDSIAQVNEKAKNLERQLEQMRQKQIADSIALVAKEKNLQLQLAKEKENVTSGSSQELEKLQKEQQDLEANYNKKISYLSSIIADKDMQIMDMNAIIDSLTQVAKANAPVDLNITEEEKIDQIKEEQWKCCGNYESSFMISTYNFRCKIIRDNEFSYKVDVLKDVYDKLSDTNETIHSYNSDISIEDQTDSTIVMRLSYSVYTEHPTYGAIWRATKASYLEAKFDLKNKEVNFLPVSRIASLKNQDPDFISKISFEQTNLSLRSAIMITMKYFMRHYTRATK
jgi:uncharacterized caspase-like protein